MCAEDVSVSGLTISNLPVSSVLSYHSHSTRATRQIGVRKCWTKCSAQVGRIGREHVLDTELVVLAVDRIRSDPSGRRSQYVVNRILAAIESDFGTEAATHLLSS